MERKVRRREEIGRTLGRKRREMLARGEKAIGMGGGEIKRHIIGRWRGRRASEVLGWREA